MASESGNPEQKYDILKHNVDVNSMYITTMQEHFKPPSLPKCSKGTRKEVMEKLLWEKIANEIAEANKVYADDKHYDTEYMVKFGAKGFLPRPMKINKDLHQVYPLYLDTTKSVWLDKFNRLEGATKTHSTNFRDFFKKNTSFSKPLDENLDM